MRGCRPYRCWVKRTRLQVEQLEDRVVPAWAGGTPPAVLSPLPSATQISLDGQGDALGSARLDGGEIDYFSFDAHTAGQYVVGAVGSGKPLDTSLAVFDSTGNRVGFTSADGSVTLNLGTGIYYFGITNHAASQKNYGTYNWSVNGPAAPPPVSGPTITLGGSSGTQNDGQLQQFTWNVSDSSGLSSVSVTITQTVNSSTTTIHTSTQASGSFTFDSAGLGVFTITVDAVGAQGSSNASRSVTVVDDDTTGPGITLGGSSGSESTSQTQSFTWSVADTSGLSSVLVTITRDGNSLTVPDATAASGSFNFDAYGAGTYVITVAASDGDADWTGDSSSSSSTRTVVVSSGPVWNPFVLYVNFDGAFLSYADLAAWDDDWVYGGADDFDIAHDGVTIQPFLSSTSYTPSQIEGIISQIIDYLQADLSPFGITVQRIGQNQTDPRTVVVGEGATTLFFGVSNLDNGYAHVAGDIDVGNNNRTDIAFIYDEYWGSTSTTALAMADVALHEAGHTYGLFHVRSKRDLETMGLRYSTAQQYWAQNTNYLNKSFPLREFFGNQNSYQVMYYTFVVNGGSFVTNTSSSTASFNYLREELLYGEFRLHQVTRDAVFAGTDFATPPDSPLKLAAGRGGERLAGLLASLADIPVAGAWEAALAHHPLI